jgi:hypothetical protein
MARKLKVFQTSIGFYDLAIAAPSMKAALEAWGADSNLFHQGVARESNDPDVIAATISRPGVILRRPVGSGGSFREKAELPTEQALAEVNVAPQKRGVTPNKNPARKTDKGARKERQRENERDKEEAARAKERQRRDQVIAKARAVLETAEREHNNRVTAIEAERAVVEKRSQSEEARWEKQKHRLDEALRRARE